MTATNHAVAGALIAGLIKQPAAAVPLALASHFAMDAIPHFKVTSRTFSFSKRLFWVVNIADAITAIALFIILPKFLSPVVSATTTALCMAVAVAPDLPWIYRLRQEMKTGVMTRGNQFTRFHVWIQWKEVEWAAAVEAVWLSLLAIWVIHLQ